MKAALLLMTAAAAGFLPAQQGAREDIRAAAVASDSAALVETVRNQPISAREVIAELTRRAARTPDRSDSLLAIARRVAAAYAIAWSDSFPLADLARFERMSPEQRSAKTAADSIRRQGNATSARHGVRAAMPLWRAAMRRAFIIHDTAGAAAALGNLGTAFYRESRLDSAELHLVRARQLAESVGDGGTALNALGVLGTIARERGDLRRAQEILTQALRLRAEIGDVRGMAADHNNLGLIAADLGDHEGARTRYQSALRLTQTHGLDDLRATVLLNLGNLASTESDYARAGAFYDAALGLFRSSDAVADVALVLHNLGLLELRRGDYPAARTRLAEALTLFTRAGVSADIVQVRRDLAMVDVAIGNFSSALAHLRRAEQQLALGPRRHDLAAALALARADVAVHLNRYAEAERDYARARALYRRAGDARGEVEAQQGRAMLLLDRERVASALEQLRGAARRQTSYGDNRSAALTQLLIGEALEKQGEVPGARRVYLRARDALGALGDGVGEAAALAAVGDLELAAGSPLAAEGYYRDGLARLNGATAPTVSSHLRAGLGRAIASRGAWREAVVELQRAIADAERVARTVPLAERRSTFLADKWDASETLVLLQRERGNLEAAFDVNERMRARQVVEVIARGRVRRAATPDSALLLRAQDLRAQIAELTRRLEREGDGSSALRGPTQGDIPGGPFEALARAHDEYTQALLELRDDARDVAPVLRADATSWRAVAARLASGQALLTYLVTDSTTIVFAVTPDTLRVLDLSVGRSELAPLIDFARGAIGRRPRRGEDLPWRAPLRRLYDHLVAPLESSGGLSGVRQLVIAPHGELHYLPFAALLDSRGGRDEFLVERYDVAYTPSATAWLRLRERQSSANSRVLALMPRPNTLPASREEVEGIRALYGSDATVLANGAATETAFRSLAPRYGILHLATYGVLNQHNPLFSFIELREGGVGSHDGRLEVHEVFGLALHARLVVLSACQTALGSGVVSDVPAGDDWVGLVRGFLGAGAENVIATLWAVEDRATATLMASFYQALRAGASEIAALAAAQRQALRNPATSGPFHWAGFVLVGEAEEKGIRQEVAR